MSSVYYTFEVHDLLQKCAFEENSSEVLKDYECIKNDLYYS